MRILNLYAGIGGNRKLWGDEHEVIAIENDPKIAKIYSYFFPKDKVIVADAHNFLVKTFRNFDFIWSSPPCPTHSDIRRAGVHGGKHEAVYPDMKLYEEIVFLRTFVKAKWVVENVVSYYKPLIKPFELHRHYLWSNFNINIKQFKDDRTHEKIIGSKPVYGFDLKEFDFDDKRKLLRNCVNPELGLHVLKSAFKDIQQELRA